MLNGVGCQAARALYAGGYLDGYGVVKNRQPRVLDEWERNPRARLRHQRKIERISARVSARGAQVKAVGPALARAKRMIQAAQKTLRKCQGIRRAQERDEQSMRLLKLQLAQHEAHVRRQAVMLSPAELAHAEGSMAGRALAEYRERRKKRKEQHRRWKVAAKDKTGTGTGFVENGASARSGACAMGSLEPTGDIPMVNGDIRHEANRQSGTGIFTAANRGDRSEVEPCG